ncbi:hypothetical protein M413DRAFT_108531 [Hebeloma cylindrosporum]|uniref:Uncharacterized protein n=1 Tax=Hebeloma cylindrosporum TaxID=76867 RepID=A0A0C2YI41_HEBCY|nr:hypothetical protein M413DRAFT_108531 [Hebeloma cylindrosporum h7]
MCFFHCIIYMWRSYAICSWQHASSFPGKLCSRGVVMLFIPPQPAEEATHYFMTSFGFCNLVHSRLDEALIFASCLEQCY